MSDAPPEPSREATTDVFSRFAVGPSSARRVTASGSDVENRSLAKAALTHLHGIRYRHDLDDRISGLNDLRSLTLGDPRVTIVILDGDPDLTLSSLRSSRITKLYPDWHDRAVPITVEQHALFREIAESDLPNEQKEERFLAAFSPSLLFRFMVDRHATHITSVIAGQLSAPVLGIAPDCRVIIVPLNEAGDPAEFLSPLNLGRALDLAHGLGADIIHCSACVPTQTDAPHELLARAIQRCVDDNILIIAPAGNNAGECRCIPAVLPGTLAVGALKDDGAPFKFSNWGGHHSSNGIMAPGEKVIGAQPGTETPVREMGTSVAAPIVTGISALLMSRQLQTGRPIDAAAIRAALLDTARACDPDVSGEPERCLRGVIDLPATYSTLFATGGAGRPTEQAAAAPRSGVVASITPALPEETPKAAAAPSAAPGAPLAAPAQAAVRAAGEGSIEPSTAHSGLVYALGSLSYDFGSEIGVQEFEQYMDREARLGGLDPATPRVVGDLIKYLEANPTERDCLIWTLVIDGTPVYGLVPDGPFDDAIYDVFLQLLAGQAAARETTDFIERISIPGRRTGETIRLHSKARIPIVAVSDLRGIYGWKINALVGDAVNRIYGARKSRASRLLQDALTDFLNRIYFDLHNLGQKSRDRAMNFAATNLFQAASVFAEAIDEGREFDTMVVKQSPLCRMHSDCWDVSLTFFDSGDEKRAAKIFEFTIDVSDIVPLTVGNVKSWFRKRGR